MSKSRKFKFRPTSRPPPPPPSALFRNENVASVPLASKFKELVEQDAFVEQIQAPIRNGTSTTMAQRLQDMLGEAENHQYHQPVQRIPCSAGADEGAENSKVAMVFHHLAKPLMLSGCTAEYDDLEPMNDSWYLFGDGDTSRGTGHLRNDESEALESDHSDHKDHNGGGRSRRSVKVVPMAQRLQELLEEGNTQSRQRLHNQKHLGQGQVEADLELDDLQKDDEIEACDSILTQIPPESPPVTKAHPLPRIAEQFHEALLAAPIAGIPSLPSIQIPMDHDATFSTRLQRVFQLEKLQHANYTKGPPSNNPFDSIRVRILKKSLEGRLTTCKCEVIQAPLTWMAEPSDSSSVNTVKVIFNSKVAAELDVDVGGLVRIDPPWQQLTIMGGQRLTKWTKRCLTFSYLYLRIVLKWKDQIKGDMAPMKGAITLYSTGQTQKKEGRRVLDVVNCCGFEFQAMATCSNTVGRVITCKAGVCYAPNKPVKFEDINVAPPQATEVRIKMTYACICQSDLYFWKGKDVAKLFPRILGHEGCGIVESVGANVRHIKPGDKCIPVWQAECTKCDKCKSPRTNICDTFIYNWGSGLMPSDKKTTRFTRVEDGKPIYHFFGISVFSQYTVVDEACVAKINPAADLTKVCLLGCGIPTGVGSAWKIAKVHPKSTVAVFGLGTIGLAVVEACKVSGCSRIIGVARDDGKLQRAMEFGLTDTLNTKSYTKPIEEVICEMTNGGVDYSFDCTGDVGVIYSALECATPCGGISIILGLVESSQRVSFHPGELLWGRSWTSGLFGGYKGRSELPELVDRCIKGDINLDHYITHKLPFSKINEAFELLNQGGCIRCVMDYEK